MFEFLAKYLSSKIEVTAVELEMLRDVHLPRKIRKKQYILQQGDVCQHTTFIVKGCLRSYRLSDDGNEHILRFGVENWWINDSESFHIGAPAKSYIDALEDSEIIQFQKDDFNILLAAIPNLRALTETLQAKSYDAIQDRVYTHISTTAEEKYHAFLKTYPDIYNRVPLHMVASYLGVSRETLSRIRNTYAHK